jgi:L-asparaginase
MPAGRTGDGVLVIAAGGNVGLFAEEVRREWVVRPASVEELEKLVVGEVSAAQRTVGGALVLREGSVSGIPIRVRFTEVRPEAQQVYEPEDLDSAQVDPARWEAIAKVIKQEYSQYEGFVILHGLDTMAYTASALSFMIGTPNLPIVLTGAQRPLNYGRTDALQNIVSSIAIAASRSLGISPVIEEVCVYSHDTLFRGNRVTMTSSSSYRSFDSPNYAPLAVAGEHIEIQEHVLWRAGNRNTIHYRKDARARVVIIDVFPGMDATLIASLSSNRVATSAQVTASAKERSKGELRGVLLRTYGMGTAPTSEKFLHALQEVVDSGIVVMNVTQARSGRISRGTDPVSLRLMEQGVVSGGDMTAEAAYAKMVVLLSDGTTPVEQADLLQVALCGEQSQSIFNVHFEAGETVEEGGAYYAYPHQDRPIVARHELRLEDITHVQLRLLGVKPAKIAAHVNRTIELQAHLVEKFQDKTEVIDKLIEDTLRWRPEGRETVNVAYDVTEAVSNYVMQPSIIIRLQTSEAIQWSRMSLAIFANVRLSDS